MAVTWTPDQQRVINTRNRNLLVSAAAGSGKTAVLVERVIQMITDEKNPVDIDKLLIVTFTKAAAGEMKERILAAVEKKLAENPKNGHLQRQMFYIHHAKIMTIHSFCLQVIRENFDRLSIDPGFRIGDEGELELLKQDTVKEVLEQFYEEGGEEFYQFAESFASGKSDEVLESLILQLDRASNSNPNPDKWLAGQLAAAKRELVEEAAILNSDWMQRLLVHVKQSVKSIEFQMQRAIREANSFEGPIAYLPALEDDQRFVLQLKQCVNFNEYREVFQTLKFQTLARVTKKDAVNGEKQELVKNLRDAWKNQLTSLKESFFEKELSQIQEELRLGYTPLAVLIRLTAAYRQAFHEKKQVKNIVDFNDLEHFALEILCVEDENGNMKPSEIGRAMAKDIYEIMVDEYQDSNLIQENILKSVSGECDGKPNIFMVGDVKQSIYKFRLARPELFMEKYETYTEHDSPYQKITLGKNFRSRAGVLYDINDIFVRIMRQEVGNIAYTDDHALHPGATYPELPKGQSGQSELLVISGETYDGTGSTEEADVSKVSTEAYLIAEKIREMIESRMQVLDKKTQQYRDVRYGDIVILLRTMKGWGEDIADTLMSCGIPAYCETSTGYFNTIEVRTVLHLLSALDNPRDDISLAAVLKSPMGRFSSEELAQIKILGNMPGYYNCCKEVLAAQPMNESAAALQKKLAGFFARFDNYRNKVTYTSVYQIIDELLEETGYRYYVAAMPSGERRLANLEMLMEKAAVYEETSYRGLFRFVRYIEKLKQYEVDFGEAQEGADSAETVRIMSIHKSKGLEFPVVIVAGVAKKFNFRDSAETLLLHPELGIGVDGFDTENRMIYRSLKRKILGNELRLESIAEELRVLYVAATRAKEKLIFIGYCDNYNKKEMEYAYLRDYDEMALPYGALCSAKSYLDLLTMVCAKGDARLQLTILPKDLIYHNVLQDSAQMDVKRQTIANWEADSEDEAILQKAEQLFARFHCDYPHQEATTMVSKQSVSDVKHRYMDALSQEEDTQEQVPVAMFVAQAEGMESGTTGAERGTAYHKILELWDYETTEEEADIRERIAGLVRDEKIPAHYPELIHAGKLKTFLTSELGQRIKAAKKSGNLMREKQFVMGVPAKEIKLSETSEEMILMQGMIDACFYEDGEIVLVDYKTDRVSTAKELIDRYQIQVELYSRALENGLDAKVKEVYLYSFALNKAILVQRKDGH